MPMKQQIWSYEYEKGKQIAAGKLLLAEPFMLDENFSRTVVLICEHDPENGTMGLILNKPVKIRLNEVLPSLPPFQGQLYLGGPVGTETMQFLHCVGEKIEGSVKLVDGLYWGGNFEQIKILIENNQISPSHIAFYIGYSGWAAGQLQAEMENNSWIVADAAADYIFNFRASLWRDILRKMGGVYETMSGYPENPILN
jgi:putative transcriptional regulator